MKRITGGYYRTGDFLRAKHRRVRHDSGRRFERWALDLVPTVTQCRVLDAGCGWGRFLWPLVGEDQIPPERVVAADLSLGMLGTARQEAERRRCAIGFCHASIDALPFATQSFDLAIAAHVLYHLPDIHRGVRELARVLRPEGRLLATTNADSINPLILDLHRRALQSLGIAIVEADPSSFSMENGAAYLDGAFDRVDTYYFADTETWPSAAAFVDHYVTIGRYRAVIEDETIPPKIRQQLVVEVQRLAAEVAERDGVLRSPTLMGAFVGRHPRDPRE